MSKAYQENISRRDSEFKAAGARPLYSSRETSDGLNSIWHDLAVGVTGPARLNTLNPPLSKANNVQVQRSSDEYEHGDSELKSFGVQAKLTLGAPNDEYEQESDRVADQVMRMPQLGIQGDLLSEEQETPDIRSKSFNISLIQRQCPECDEEEPVQTKQANGTKAVSSVTLGKINSLSGNNYLSESLRNYFEPRFGSDFSQVRVLDGAEPAKTARALHARAFTRGHDIVFGAGEYRPETEEGRKLIAHELTHVVQQKGRTLPVQRKYTLPELRRGLARAGTGAYGYQVSTSPAVYYYSGSSGNTHNRRAFVMAGIHGDEEQAKQLGRRVRSDLSSPGGPRPYFHTLIAPELNTGTSRRISVRTGSAATSLDPNRSFGGSTPVAHPIISTVTAIENEFQPERALSVHAIRIRRTERRHPLGGIYLDPLWGGQTTPPPLGTTSERRQAFTHQSINLRGMQLTERMIGSVRRGGRLGRWATSGNIPGRKRGAQFPASRYPGMGTGTSQYNLLYPMQSTISTTSGAPTSFGAWASGLRWSRAIITMEIPGLRGSTWRQFLPAVWEFLQATRPTSPTPSGASGAHGDGASQPAVRRKLENSSGKHIQCNNITEADLPSPTARGIRASERERRTFMREVYRRQIAIWTLRGGSYIHEIAPADRTTLPGSYVMPGRTVSVLTSIAGHVRNMLDAARADLAGATGAGGPAADIEELAVRSGYRSATDQFGIWQRWAPVYYRDTRPYRSALPGGEHGPEAARYLAEYTNKRVFSPGYSPHQRAVAVDLTYKYRSGLAPAGAERGGWAPASSSPTWINTWRRSWFFNWLWRNAPQYGFMRNPDINEPWHWEFRPTSALVVRFIRWLLDLLDSLLDTGWSARFEESFSGGQGPLRAEEEEVPE